MLRFLTAGESHGQALVVTLDGMPAGLQLDIDALNEQLRRRQGGYGRGRRMAIESDRAEILTGVRHGQTTGAPIALLIRNRDWVNWQQTMHVEPEMPEGASGVGRPNVTRPRPGHADLAGAIKYGRDDIRDVLERASARETAARVAAGSLARQLLACFSVRIASHVSVVGDAMLRENRVVSFAEAQGIPEDAPLRCADPDVQQRMIAAIDEARDAGDTLGGVFEVIATGVPPGLGSYVQWDRKLDGRLGQARDVHSRHQGSRHRDWTRSGRAARLAGFMTRFFLGRTPASPLRPTNNAGGLEGGVTNGEDVRVVGFMKPISTLMKPLRSVDLSNDETRPPPAIERSDVCAVPAAAVVGEAMVAFVLADAFLEKFGGDSIRGDRASLRVHGRTGAPALCNSRHLSAPPRRPGVPIAHACATSWRCARRGRRACMIRPILRYGEQILHQPAVARRGHITPDIQQLVDDMVQTMYCRAGDRAGRDAGRASGCGFSSPTCRAATTRETSLHSSTRKWSKWTARSTRTRGA